MMMIFGNFETAMALMQVFLCLNGSNIYFSPGLVMTPVFGLGRKDFAKFHYVHTAQ